jgi:hypothetical protein
MAELTVFKSRAMTMGYAFKSGKVVHFLAGMYATAAKDEIEELTTECDNAHPNFYIDPAQKTIDSEMMDPVAVLRAKIREEERALILAAMGNPQRDMGTTPQGKLEGIANSHTINGMQASSEAQASAAQTPIPAGTIKVGAINIASGAKK